MTDITTASGIPVADNQNSITAGPRGPVLLQDFHLIEKLQHFNRERIPERVVHAKGSGAYGTFTVTHDITQYTRAALFSAIGKRTATFLRFSTVGGEKGSADTERDPRGFALRFYTGEGNWDLVGNNTPTFFLKDGIKFPDFIHTQKRDPQTNLKSAQMMWDFWSRAPESLHQVTILFSDRGTPDGYRHMDGFGSHTYSLINADGQRVWVKWHFKTQQGIRNLAAAEAVRLAGADPDYAQRDLFAYHDAQLYRVGTNHQHLPVNRPRCPFHNQQRDGAMAIVGGGAAANYDTVRAGAPAIGGLGHGDAGWQLDGVAGRYDTRDIDDHHTQAGNLYRLLRDEGKRNLVENIAASLSGADAATQDRQIGHFLKADLAYGHGVAEAIRRLQNRG